MLEQTGSKEARNRYGLANKNGNKLSISEKATEGAESIFCYLFQHLK